MDQNCPDIEQPPNFSPHNIRPTSSPNFNNLMSPIQRKDEINSEDKNNSVNLDENQENNSKNGSPSLFPINNSDLKDLETQNDDTENENRSQQSNQQQNTQSQQQASQTQSNSDEIDSKHQIKQEETRSHPAMPKKQVNEYAQQQSQIFVYPTGLANKAAEAVDNGEFDSIIDFHCAQEETKKILALHPLNTAQFNRQGHPNWFDATHNRNRKFMPSRQQFAPNKDLNTDFLWDEGDGSNRIPPSDMMGNQPSLQGVKVPDENLTPQQRQHREEQLATIRKLTKMFCLEAGQGQPGGKPGHMGPIPPNGNMEQMNSQMRPPHPGQIPSTMQRNNMAINDGQMGMNPVETMRNMDPNSMQAKLEWERIQKQHFNEMNGSNMPINRQMMIGNNSIRPQFPPDIKTEPDLQPPPPYHLTSRPMPPMQNSNPASPNPPSNISLPSPRTSDPLANNNRQLNSQSNPSTPLQPNLSPSFKEQAKDTNLMPVPSPQQIPFLNSFEGQEQTIQKEPNTKAKGDDSFQDIDKNLSSLSQLSETSMNEETKPIPTNPDASPRPGSNPPLSNAMNKNDPFNSTSPDMHMRFSPNLPNLKMGNQARPFASPEMGNFMDGPGVVKQNPSSMVSSGTTNIQSFSNARTDNIPLNPNSTIAGISKASHFDPISSLAQMSQQLTSNAGASMNSGGVLGGPPGGMMGNFNHGMNHPGMMGAGMNNMNNPMEGGMMPGGFGGGMMNNMPRSLSPKSAAFGDPSMGMPSISPKLGMDNMGMGGPRMIGRPPMMGNNPGAFNGNNAGSHPANVLVKPNAPNTIQYLPARPQIGNQNPRPPPSLEFLQRYTNPMSDNMNRNMPGQSNMPYYNPQPGMPGQNMGMPMMNVPGGGIPHVPGGSHGMMGQGAMMRGLRPPTQNNMMRMQGNFNDHPGQNNPGGPPMFGMNGGKDQQMLGPNAGPHPANMNGGGPGYPPNMPNRFKSPEFAGQAPAPGNPNYAQQYHNFQQQLYATNTRN